MDVCIVGPIYCNILCWCLFVSFFSDGNSVIGKLRQHACQMGCVLNVLLIELSSYRPCTMCSSMPQQC